MPFAILAGSHMGLVAIYRTAFGWVRPWRSPLRYRRGAHPGSFAAHVATSAVLAIPSLAIFQFLSAFWSAASSGALFYHNIYGSPRTEQAIAGLLGSAMCLHLLAIVVGGRLTARTASSRGADTGPRCDWCGYPAAGGICPECGRQAAGPPARRGRLGRVFLPAGLAGAALLFAFTPLLMSWWSIWF